MKCGSTFLRGLALGSVQCGAIVPSAPLPTLSTFLSPPCPPTKVNDKGITVQACVTLSAGKSFTVVLKKSRSVINLICQHIIMEQT